MCQRACGDGARVLVCGGSRGGGGRSWAASGICEFMYLYWAPARAARAFADGKLFYFIVICSIDRTFAHLTFLLKFLTLVMFWR